MQEVFRTSGNRSFAIICVTMNGLEWKFAPISSPGNSAGLASSTPNRASDDSQPPGPGPLEQPISLATALESVSTI